MVGDMSEQPGVIDTISTWSSQTFVTIPGHPGDDVPAGTMKSILKAAGLEKKQ